MLSSIACEWQRRGVIYALALASFCASACSRETTDTVTSGLSVRYLEACKPRRIEQITIEALGDFATRESSFVAIDVQDGSQTVDALPLDARLFRLQVVTASFSGSAIAKAADEGERFDALILPRSEPCLSISQNGLLPSGAAVALAGDDDLLIAGGQRNDNALNDVRRLHVNGGRSTRIEPDLFVPRHGAAAVRTGSETWILGGTQALVDESPAFDAFERYDAQNNSLGGIGRMAVARTDLAALTLANDDVLIAGGRKSQGAESLDSMERIAVGTGTASTLRTPLPWPLAGGRLLLRDDGVIAILGKADQTLLFALFDARSERIEDINTADLSTTPELVTALPGARMALFEVDEQGVTTGTLLLMLESGDVLRLERALTSFAGVSQGRSLTLRDGQVLLTGLRNGEPLARVIDPGTLNVRVIPLSVLPEQLFLRDDGVALLLTRDGLSVLRNDERTPYDNPGGTLLASDTAVVAFDAVGRWARDGLALRAEASGARFDLAGLSYQDVEIEIEATGDVDLILRLEGGAERTVQVGLGEVGPALCTSEHERGAPVRLVRTRDALQLETGKGKRTCQLDGFLGRMSLAVRAREVGAEVARLVVTRRE